MVAEDFACCPKTYPSAAGKIGGKAPNRRENGPARFPRKQHRLPFRQANRKRPEPPPQTFFLYLVIPTPFIFTFALYGSWPSPFSLPLSVPEPPGLLLAVVFPSPPYRAKANDLMKKPILCCSENKPFSLLLRLPGGRT